MHAIRLLTMFALLSGCETEEPTTPPSQGGAECTDEFCILSGTLTEDTTLTADMKWLLRGGVFVGDDTTPTVLTIEPGTTIYGESSTDGMLVVTRNAQIIAEGTEASPIVFTSSKPEGSRARGDWGGLILNGNARVNSCGDESVSLCEAFGEGGTGWYGGNDDEDSSGILSYVRVEFAGTLVSPDNELNGIAFQGVGSGTTVDHVQVHMAADDGVEFFGGTASVKHLLVTGVGDDSLDWTDGWRGKAQFVVLEHYEDAGDNGIEADNNGDANDALPFSRPELANVTILGVDGASSSDVGILLREGTQGALHSVITQGYNEACVDIDHTVTYDNLSAGDLVLTNSLFDCAARTDGEADDVNVAAWLDDAGNSNETGDPGLGGTSGYLPSSTSATTGGVQPEGAFFETVAFKGGVDPADDWTEGWTLQSRN